MSYNPTRFSLVVADAIALPYTAGAALTKHHFNQANTTTGRMEVAAVNAEGIVGVLESDVAADGQEALEIVEGKSSVVFDTTLDEQNLVKVGSAGCATLWKDSQTTIQTTITGEATAVTQPAAASVMTVATAADVAGDRGRVVRVVGGGATGLGIYEDITLDAADSSTGIDGVVEFTTLSGVYMADGAVAGAQNVTVTDDDPALLMTLPGAGDNLAADVPAQNQEAYCNILDLVGPNSDSTFVSIAGYKAATPTVLTVERLTLDGSSPSVISTVAEYRYIERICLGEFTNAGTASVKTDGDVDVPEKIQGRCIIPGAYAETGAIQLA